MTSNITLTIKCDLDLDEIYGRVHVYTTTDKKMDWVMDEFCREKNVKRVSTFALKNSAGFDYDLTKSIEECNLADGDLIYCYNKNPPKPKPPVRSRQKGPKAYMFLIAAILCFLVALAGIIAVIVIYETKNANTRQYAVVVDAGSSSSKVYMYSWPTSLVYNTGKVKQDFYQKTMALSNYMEHPSNASRKLIDVISKEIIQKDLIKGATVEDTPLFLGATAGMRMEYARDKRAVDAIFKVLRTDLPKKLKLKVTNPESQIRILSGASEAIDAWVTVNYLQGTLGEFINNVFKKSSDPTIGSLDLGGASTQIAFEPKPADIVNASGIQTLSLYGKQHQVYSHSFLCYGKQQATFRNLALLVKENNFTTNPIANPCYATGYQKNIKAKTFLLPPCTKGVHGKKSYGFEINVPSSVKPNTAFKFIGTSDYASCKANVEKLFSQTLCTTPPCSFNSVYQPPINGNYNAFAGFYYVANFFNATEEKRKPKATYFEYEDSVRRYCASDWNTTTVKYGNGPFIVNYCFDGIYVQKLLTNYGFVNGTWKQLNFLKEIKNTKVGWSLGFALLESGRITMESFTSISLPLFIGLVILFCIILLMALILAVLAYRNRHARGNRFQSGVAESYGSI